MALANQKPKAILMDLDDTIVSFDSVSRAAWVKCCDEFAAVNPVRFSGEQLYRSISDVKQWYWADPVRHKKGRENLREARREVVSAALKSAGCPKRGMVAGGRGPLLRVAGRGNFFAAGRQRSAGTSSRFKHPPCRHHERRQ